MKKTYLLIALTTIILSQSSFGKEQNDQEIFFFHLNELHHQKAISSDSASYQQFVIEKKKLDPDCSNSSSEIREPRICKIDIYVSLDPNNGKYPCTADLTDEVHTNSNHDKVMWVLKPTKKGDEYSYQFVNEWDSIPAILLVNTTGFDHFDNDNKRKFVWYKISGVISRSKYLVLISWVAKDGTSGYCQIIDPVIAND